MTRHMSRSMRRMCFMPKKFMVRVMTSRMRNAHDRMIGAAPTIVRVPLSVMAIPNNAMSHVAMHHRVVARSHLGSLARGSLILVASVASAITRLPTASGGVVSRERTTTALEHPLALEIRETRGPVSYERRADVGAW